MPRLPQRSDARQEDPSGDFGRWERRSPCSCVWGGIGGPSSSEIVLIVSASELTTVPPCAAIVGLGRAPEDTVGEAAREPDKQTKQRAQAVTRALSRSLRTSTSMGGVVPGETMPARCARVPTNPAMGTIRALTGGGMARE